MRMIRALAAAATLATMLPAIAAAQQGRPFKDAWFWGVKAGGMTYADAAGNTKQAPAGGIEWLITRTHGGLYVAASQAFFTTTTFVADNPNTPEQQTRLVNMKNLRRVDLAMMGFPGTHIIFHPYGGIGVSLAQIANAVAPGPYGLPADSGTAAANIQDTKVAFTPIIIAGAQYRLRWLSVFAQATMTPIQQNFLLYNGQRASWGYDIGVRYNIGSSIEKE